MDEMDDYSGTWQQLSSGASRQIGFQLDLAESTQAIWLRIESDQGSENCFQNAPNIEKLYLNYIRINHGIDVIFQTLRKLTELDLTGVDMGSSLSNKMLANLTVLKKLSTSKTHIGTFLPTRWKSSTWHTIILQS